MVEEEKLEEGEVGRGFSLVHEEELVMSPPPGREEESEGRAGEEMESVLEVEEGNSMAEIVMSGSSTSSSSGFAEGSRDLCPPLPRPNPTPSPPSWIVEPVEGVEGTSEDFDDDCCCSSLLWNIDEKSGSSPKNETGRWASNLGGSTDTALVDLWRGARKVDVGEVPRSELIDGRGGSFSNPNVTLNESLGAL